MFIDNSIVDINPLSNFDFKFDSIFSDINALFKEQEVSSMIKYNSGYATNPYTNTSTSQTNSLVLENEFTKSNTLGSSSPQLIRRRTNIKQKRSEG
jgi:hypothetical protein